MSKARNELSSRAKLCGCVIGATTTATRGGNGGIATTTHHGRPWRDGLFPRRRHLFDRHARSSFLQAWCCPQVLIAQLLAHTSFNKETTMMEPQQTSSGTAVTNGGQAAPPSPPRSWCGTFQAPSSSAWPNKKMLMIWCMLLVVEIAVIPGLVTYLAATSGNISGSSSDDQDDAYTNATTTAKTATTADAMLYISSRTVLWEEVLYGILSLPMTIYTLRVLVRMRQAIRQQHDIQDGRLLIKHLPTRSQCWQDCCVMFWCTPCGLWQMARQVQDDNNDISNDDDSCSSSVASTTSLTSAHSSLDASFEDDSDSVLATHLLMV